MPSQTILVRSHARTIHTHPVTFICAQCHTPTTRECYPGKTPQYCLECRPRRKRSSNNNQIFQLGARKEIQKELSGNIKMVIFYPS